MTREEATKIISAFIPSCVADADEAFELAIEALQEPERVHGMWIGVPVRDCCYRCTNCQFIRDAYLLDIANFCPNCGAKMVEKG